MLGAALYGLSFATPALAANPVLSGDCLLSNPTGDNWIAPTPSSWATAGNWSSGVPASSTAQTNITNMGTAQISAAANAGTALNLCDGEVDLGTGGSLTAGAIAIGPNGTLVLNDSAATVTVTDAIYLNGGHLRATTTDTFSSKIVIGNADKNTGTISAAAGKTLTLTGPITVGTGVTNADLIFGTPGDTGTGTVIYAPAAASTYAGNMTINYGTLQIGNGSAAGAITGDISNNATLAFDLASTSLYGGVISGAGQLQQNGTGNIFLSGLSTSYTGPTTVNSGTLTVTGSIAHSAVTVNPGGTLAGTGTVGATTVAGPTTVSGNTIGGGRIAAGGALTGGTQTLTINGNLTLSPGSVYVASVAPVPSSPPNSPPPSSRLAVNGTATITGALLDISPNSQATAGVKYTLLTSTGLLNGTFTLGSGGAIGNYLATLSYDAHDAYLQFALIQLTPNLPTGATSNQNAVTGGIDNAITHGTTLTPGFSHLATLSSTQLATAADQLSGEIGSDLSNIVTAQMNPFLTVLMTQPGDLDTVLGPGRRHNATLWGTFFGGGGNTSADNSVGSHALSNNEFGFATGLDVMLASSFQMGAALAANRTNFTLASNLGTGTDNAYQAGLYLTKRFGRSFYISAAGAYSMGDITTTRKLTLAGNDTLSGKVTAHTAAGRIETGYRFGFGRMGLTPYVAFQYDRFNAPAYTETAPAGEGQFAIDYAAHTSPTTSYEIGTGIDYASASSRRSSLHLYGRVAWAHATTTDPNVTEDFHTLANSSFTVQGSAPPANSALLTFGAELRGKNGLSIGFKLNGALSQSSTAYFGTGDLKYSW